MSMATHSVAIRWVALHAAPARGDRLTAMSNMPLWERYLGLPLLKFHDAMYQRSKGRLGHRIPGQAPILMLHTVGAKTGISRTNSLSYAVDGPAYLVVASKGGEPTAPGWYHNLKANPQVEINVGPKRMPATARIIGADDPDYPRLWKLVNDNNSHRYEGYQKRTTRPIPIIALTPG
jgi:deazaflavin-dependent oxidoreductase (nitroreductase family)